MDLGPHPIADTATLVLLVSIVIGYVYLALRLSRWLRKHF
jgi:hypothetical protein